MPHWLQDARCDTTCTITTLTNILSQINDMFKLLIAILVNFPIFSIIYCEKVEVLMTKNLRRYVNFLGMQWLVFACVFLDIFFFGVGMLSKAYMLLCRPNIHARLYKQLPAFGSQQYMPVPIWWGYILYNLFCDLLCEVI